MSSLESSQVRQSAHPCSRLRSPQWQVWVRHGLGWGLGLVGGLLLGGSAAIAAETVTIQFGPLSQSITITELEQFATTGLVPARLRLYRPLLTPQVRQALNQRLDANPDMGHKVVKDLLSSHSGARLLATINTLTPDTSIEEIELALADAAQAEQGWSVLALLKALPEANITLDASSILAIAAQLNFAYLQSQSLSQILAQQLAPADPSVAVSQLPFGELDPTAPGNYIVRQQPLVLRDRERNRSIPVDLYWNPYSQGPLVVISHGFGADRNFLAYLANHLASHGLVVAAIEHPGSNVEALNELAQPDSSDGTWEQPEAIAGQAPSRILPATEFIDRPKDVSLVLDHLHWLNRYSYRLKDRINTDEVTMIGHSMGGYTALVLAGAELDLGNLYQVCNDQQPLDLSPAAWLQCAATELSLPTPQFTDDRVKQVILLNPIIGQLFGERGLRSLRTPVLMLTSTNDPVTPTVPQQLWPFVQINQPKYLVTAIHANHLSVGDPNHLNPVLVNNPILRERPPEATEPLRALVRGMSLAFVMQQTDRREQYAPFLSAHYAQTLSTEGLPLYVSSDLPAGLTQWVRLAAQPSSEAYASWRWLGSAIHLEAIGAWDQVALAQQQALRSLHTNYPAVQPLVFGLF